MRVKAARKHAKMSRAEFGRIFTPPVSYETVRQWEAGETNPRHDKFAQMEVGTGVRASWIESGVGPMLVGDDAMSIDELQDQIMRLPREDRWALVARIAQLSSPEHPEEPSKPAPARRR